MFKGFLILVFVILFLISCSKRNSVSEQYDVTGNYSISQQYDEIEQQSVTERYDYIESDSSSKLGTRIKANLRLILFVIF